MGRRRLEGCVWWRSVVADGRLGSVRMKVLMQWSVNTNDIYIGMLLRILTGSHTWIATRSSTNNECNKHTYRSTGR
jgi:hypothetical protein